MLESLHELIRLKEAAPFALILLPDKSSDDNNIQELF
jgi:hypothetical protein